MREERKEEREKKRIREERRREGKEGGKRKASGKRGRKESKKRQEVQKGRGPRESSTGDAHHRPEFSSQDGVGGGRRSGQTLQQQLSSTESLVLAIHLFMYVSLRVAADNMYVRGN